MEIVDGLYKRIQDLRKSIGEEPSERTLAFWKLQDIRYKMMRNYCARREELDNENDEITVNFNSEVKRK